MTPVLAPSRARGADRSFERLYQKHVHAVYRYALAVLHNEPDAEDVTQTTFLSAYRAFQRGERPEKPHNWLIKIAHNVCRQRFRDSSRRPQEVEFDESLAAAAPEDTDIPTAGEIRRALGFLGFNQRAALVMRELEGRSYAEIAQILDVSVGAVETLLFRARRALREQLEGGLTCADAELTLSRLQEEKLSSSERGALRAHLRECKECALLERRQRAQRAAIKSIGTVPLPASLASFFGSGAVGSGVAVGGIGIGAKVATVLAAGLVATGVGREAVEAVQAENGPSKANRPAAVVDYTRFSSVSMITNGRADTNAITGVVADKRRSKAPGSNRFSGASKRLHGIAAGKSGQGSGSGSTGSTGSNAPGSQPANASQLPQVPQAPPPPVPLPPPPVQLPAPVPPVPVPPVPIPPVPPLPPPPIPVPPIPPPPIP